MIARSGRAQRRWWQLNSPVLSKSVPNAYCEAVPSKSNQSEAVDTERSTSSSEATPRLRSACSSAASSRCVP